MQGDLGKLDQFALEIMKQEEKQKNEKKIKRK